MFPTIKLIIATLCVCLTGNVHALFQCKNAQGSTSFQDQPCATDQRAVTPPNAATPVNPAPRIGSEQHIKGVADALNRQVEERVKNSPPPPRPALGSQSTSSATPQSQPMPFEQCVATVNRTALQLGLGWRRAPVVINSADLYIRRMCTDTGSVLVTCSRPDQMMNTTTSPRDSNTGCK